MIHVTEDEAYDQTIHELVVTPKKMEEICRYDLDDLDITFLKLFNELHEQMGEKLIHSFFSAHTKQYFFDLR